MATIINPGEFRESCNDLEYLIFFCSLIARYVPHKPREKMIGPFDDILNHLREWGVILVILWIWLMVTFVMDVPGCGKGYLGPGGIGNNGQYWNCTGGAAGYVDMQVFGKYHIYKWPTCGETYVTGAFDPEGLLGCLTTIAHTYLGLQAGRIILYHKDHTQRMLRFAIWAVALGVITLGLSGGKENGGAIPINKNLWSLSFTTCQSCTGLIGLGISYVLVDWLQVWNGAPFRYVGMNSIAIYCLHEVLSEYFPFHWNLTANQYETHGPQLAENLIGTSLWLLVSYYFYTIDFFVKI